MQADDVVWSVLNGQFCSNKVVTKAQKFCRSEYNVNGICSRTTCPLANSQYATVREEQGICYLYSKIAERSHYPAKMWEKTKLSRNMDKAKQQIEEKLKWWPKPMRKKCHLRFLTIHDYLNRIRKLMMTRQKQIVPIRKKIERRETKKETKALAAAKLEKVIEKELLRRLKENTYGDMYNFSQVAFDKALDAIEDDGEAIPDADAVEDEDEERESETESEYVEDFDESEAEDEEPDIEDAVMMEEQEIEDVGRERKNVQRFKIPFNKKPSQRVQFKENDAVSFADEGDSEAEDEEDVVTLWKRPQQARKPRLEIEYETEPAARRKLTR